MKRIVAAAVSIASLFHGSDGHAAPPNGNVPKLMQQQQQQLLGEVIGVGIAGAVIGAAINESNHNHNGWNKNNGWHNNNNNNNGWNNNNNGWNNNNNGWNNNNNGWNQSNGVRYDYVPNPGVRPQQSTVYRNGYPVEPVYSSQPIYSAVEDERIISSGPVITGERVISSSPVVSSERVVAASAIKENSLPYKGPGVSISLDKETGGSVTYLIDGVEEATIEAGQQQTLSKKGKYEVRFSRGRGSLAIWPEDERASPEDIRSAAAVSVRHRR